VRLLFVIPEYPPHTGGGLLRYYRALAPALAAAGVEVTVLVAAPFSADFEGYSSDGVTVRCLPGPAVADASRSLPQFSAAATFRGWLAASVAARRWAESGRSVDVVETTDFGLGFASFLVQGCDVPVIVRLHGSLGQIADHEPVQPAADLDTALVRLTEGSLLSRAAELQTYSSANAADWRRQLSRDVQVIPAPVQPGPVAEHTGDYGLVVGRVQPWKGAEVLCRALQALDAGTVPTVRWVGRDTRTAPDGGSYDSYLRSRYGGIWGGRIERLDQQPYEAVLELVGRARFVVCPSDWDVFNFTVAEAMGAARVVICSDGAGASELIVPGTNGIRFAAGDAGALAKVLADVSAWPTDRLAQMGKEARATVVARLAPADVASQWIGRAETVRSHWAPPEPAPEGVRTFFEPAEDRTVHAAFLDQLGGRQIAAHLGRRAWSRLTGRGAG
jgi:glycosyltransferase involved in cell wall biosynthesis